jgi:hypothetical protein
VGFVQKELAIAERLFCMLIDGDDDRLNMLIAVPASKRRSQPTTALSTRR